MTEQANNIPEFKPIFTEANAVPEFATSNWANTVPFIPSDPTPIANN